MNYTYGHWISDFPITTDDFGFIYIITNLLTNQKYIGKRNIIVSGESTDSWQRYKSSSVTLKHDIKTLGKENFQFEIMELHSCAETLASREIELQIKYDVLNMLLEDGNKAYYNKSIHTVGFDGSGTRRSGRVKNKQSKSAKGNKVYHNPVTGESIRCKDIKLIPEGFIHGMGESVKRNMRTAKHGSITYHNILLNKEKMIKPGDVVPLGFVEGTLPGKRRQAGEYGNSRDKNVYTFINRYTLEVFVGTRVQLASRTTLSYSTLSSLVKNKIFSTICGWRLNGPSNTMLNKGECIHRKRWFNDRVVCMLLYPDDPRAEGLLTGRLT